jgi:hypothetical protein
MERLIKESICMARLTKDDLCEEYTWGEIHPEDPKVSGEPDTTPFDAMAGYEVLYLINAMMRDWDLLSKKSGHKMERMLKDLPGEIDSQEEVKAWVKDKWRTYKFKKAKGLPRRKPAPAPELETVQAPPSTPSTPSMEPGQPQHHYCTHCNGVVPSDVIQREGGESAETRLLQALSGIHYVKRARRCHHCNSEFETVEIHADALYELMQLKALVEKFRNELSDSDITLKRG